MQAKTPRQHNHRGAEITMERGLPRKLPFYFGFVSLLWRMP
jgi:hypothetical protein